MYYGTSKDQVQELQEVGEAMFNANPEGLGVMLAELLTTAISISRNNRELTPEQVVRRMLVTLNLKEG